MAGEGLEDASSTALVPFSLSSAFTDPLRLPERIITLGATTFRIEQAWEADGRGGTDLGFGASVYPAAIVLAAFLVGLGPRVLGGVRVVELGCGVGLSALVASAAGAGCVVATDGDDKAVGLCGRNAGRNDAAVRATRRALGVDEAPAVSCRRLLWGDPDATAEVAGAGVSVIIGADIAACPYAEALEDLAGTIEALLGARGAGDEAEATAAGPGEAAAEGEEAAAEGEAGPSGGGAAKRGEAARVPLGAASAVSRLVGSARRAGAGAGAACMVLAYKRRGGVEEAGFFASLGRRGVRVVARAADAELHPDFRASDGQSGLPGERVQLLVLSA